MHDDNRAVMIWSSVKNTCWTKCCHEQKQVGYIGDEGEITTAWHLIAIVGSNNRRGNIKAK